MSDRRRFFKELQCGAPTSPTSPGNHIATDSSSFPSRPDNQFVTHRSILHTDKGARFDAD